MSDNNTQLNQERLTEQANGHIHRFGIISVPPEYGHSYIRCVSCLLSKHLPDHDPATCEICRSRAPVAAPEGATNTAMTNSTSEREQRQQALPTKALLRLCRCNALVAGFNACPHCNAGWAEVLAPVTEYVNVQDALSAVKALRDQWLARLPNSDDATFKSHYQTRADAATEIITTLQSLTLEQEQK